MHILIGVVLALALLWAWLVGHWFARVLMFLVLGAAALSVCSHALIASGAPDISALAFAVALSLPVGWYVASIPTYYWNHQHRKYNDAVMRSHGII